MAARFSTLAVALAVALAPLCESRAADTVSPSTAAQGIRSLRVTVTLDPVWTAFDIQDGATVDFGAGIEIAGEPFPMPPHGISVDVNIDCLAFTGPHAPVITNPDGTDYQSDSGLGVTLDSGRADVNRDGGVDGSDTMEITTAFGAEVGSSRYSPRPDVNGDGRIDHLDDEIVHAHYQENPSTACNAP